jgi:hypothetical protein
MYCYKVTVSATRSNGSKTYIERNFHSNLDWSAVTAIIYKVVKRGYSVHVQHMNGVPVHRYNRTLVSLLEFLLSFRFYEEKKEIVTTKNRKSVFLKAIEFPCPIVVDNYFVNNIEYTFFKLYPKSQLLQFDTEVLLGRLSSVFAYEFKESKTKGLFYYPSPLEFCVKDNRLKVYLITTDIKMEEVTRKIEI